MRPFCIPKKNQRGAGYQILQSEIAVGSGGFWGKGFGKGSQNQLGFVPVRYSDFILAALAEEQGFIGVCVVLLLYLGLILRLVDNAQKAKDRAGMYVVMGVTAILGFHVLVNASMVIGYMPVTGIPLAADELRRIGHRVCFFGFGPGDERPHAAIRQLSPRQLMYEEISCWSTEPRKIRGRNSDFDQVSIG